MYGIFIHTKLQPNKMPLQISYHILQFTWPGDINNEYPYSVNCGTKQISYQLYKQR